MDTFSTLALVTGVGWASGIRLYALLFFLGVLHNTGIYVLPQNLQILAHPAVMTASGLLFVVEFFADKLPGFDSLWDAVHTFIRIPVNHACSTRNNRAATWLQLCPSLQSATAQ